MKSLEWKGCPLRRKITLLFASGFGLGLSPFASGTAGTLLGVVLVILMQVPTPLFILFTVVLVLLGIPICHFAEEHFGKKDDGRVVADEYLTFPICVILLPWQQYPLLLVLAFLTHRILDIFKPFPANRAQSLRGGLGIMIDDVISSLYALGVNHLVWYFIRTQLRLTVS